MGKVSIIMEFAAYLVHRKKFFLLPVVIMILLLGAIVLLVEHQAIAPFIYALF